MNQVDCLLDAAADKAAKDAQATAAAQFAAQAQELATLQASVLATRIGGEIAAVKQAGQLLPAQEVGLAEFMASIAKTPQSFSFSKGDGTVELDQAAFFSAFLKSLPVQVKLGPQHTSQFAAEVAGLSDSQIAARASTFRARREAAGISISAAQAVDAVVSGADRE